MNERIMDCRFVNIPDRDIPVWIKVFQKEGIVSEEEIVKEMTLMDDLLAIQRKRLPIDMIGMRIKAELGA